jgi:hypothetical protein
MFIPTVPVFTTKINVPCIGHCRAGALYLGPKLILKLSCQMTHLRLYQNAGLKYQFFSENVSASTI